jgi:hypothetical protein
VSHCWQGRPEDAGLCGPPDLSTVEATDFGNLHDRADLRPLDRASVWRILLKREVSSSAVIVVPVKNAVFLSRLNFPYTSPADPVESRLRALL